jgi:hypothetical protein
MTLRLGESGSRLLNVFDYEYLREFEVKIGTAQNVVYRTYAEPIYAKTPKNPPRCHVPLRSPGIDSYHGGPCDNPICRTGPPGYID